MHATWVCYSLHLFGASQSRSLDCIFLSPKVPCVFVHGMESDFILPAQSKELYDNYGHNRCKKEYILVPGGHNSGRGWKFSSRILTYIHSWLELPGHPLSYIPKHLQSSPILKCFIATPFHKQQASENDEKQNQQETNKSDSKAVLPFALKHTPCGWLLI